MIEIKYNHKLNRVSHKNLTDTQSTFDLIAIDLDTNLPFIKWYVMLPPNESAHFDLEKSFMSNISGIEINAYHNGDLIHTERFQWAKLDNRFTFICPKTELAYASWHSLVYDDEYKSKFKNDDVIYDLGANFGVYTMLAVNNGVKQDYAFEPTPNNVDCLKKTFKFDSNVTIFDKAIGGKDEKLIFYLQQHSVANSIHNTNGTPLEVDCINLENFINTNQLLKPTIIKCDIEGSEYDFIESCTDEFFKGIHTIIFEFHNNNNNQIWNPTKKLLNLGYNIKMNKDNYIDSSMSTFVARK